MTVTWTGKASDNKWATQKNWDPEHVPSSNDDVNIPQGAVIIFDHDVLIRSLTIGQGGPDGYITSLIGPAKITTTAALALYWSYKIACITFDAAGSVNIDTSNGQLRNFIAGALINRGKALWKGPNAVYALDGFILNNANGATFDLQSDSAIGVDYTSNAPPRFVNYGTVTKTAGDSNAASNVLMVFENTGTVDIGSGNVRFRTPLIKDNTEPQPVSGGTGSYIARGKSSMWFNRGHTFKGPIIADSVAFNENDGAGGGGDVRVEGTYYVASQTAILGGRGLFFGAVKSTGKLLLRNGAQAIFVGNGQYERIAADCEIGNGGGQIMAGPSVVLALRPLNFPSGLFANLALATGGNEEFPRMAGVAFQSN